LNFERLLLPPRPDGKTPPAKGVTVNIARDPYTQQWVGAGGLLINYFPRQFDYGYMNWFDLWEASNQSYLAASFSQYAISEYPPDMRSIAERFPPLASRVGQWSKERLLNELAHAGGFGTSVRDRVLSKELLRRDMTGDELLLLLKRRTPDESGTVLRTIVDTHQVPRFVRAIREYLRSAGGGENKANNPFDIIRRDDQADFTDAAIEVLRLDNRANPAFRYAAAHGTTLADYNALAELPPLDASYGREWYLSEMRRRLGLSQ
jgi:hypothetical protein